MITKNRLNRHNTLWVTWLSLLAIFGGVSRAGTQYATGSLTWGTDAKWSSVSGGPYDQTWTVGGDAIFEGSTGTVSIASGGVTARDISFHSSGFTITGNALSLGGSISVFSMKSGTNATVSSLIKGASSLVKAGEGLLTLTADNSYSGGTIVSNGVLSLGGANNGHSRVGPGLLTIESGARVEAAALNPLGWDNDTRTPSVVINGGTFDFKTYNGSFKTLTMKGGSLARSGGFWYFGQPASISAIGGLPVISGGSMALRPAGGAFMPLAVSAGCVLTVSTYLYNDSGASGFAKTGEGTLTLTADNAYSGGTIVSNGVLSLAGNNNGYSRVGPGTLTIETGARVEAATDNPLGWDNSATTPSVIINGGTFDFKTFDGSFKTLTLNGGMLTRSTRFWYFNQPGSITASGGAPAISGGTIDLRPAGGVNMPIAVSNDVTLTIASVLANNIGGTFGAAGINKTGAGSLSLICTNTYLGSTWVTDGILRLDGGGLLGSGGTYNGILSNNAALVFNSSSAQILNGPISGNGSLLKSGTGSLTLSGTNLYSGATGVSNGILNLTHTQCLSTNTAVSIWTLSDAKINLNFTGTNMVRSLTVDGVLQVRNHLYSKRNLPLAFHSDGNGYLFVTEGAASKGTMVRFL